MNPILKDYIINQLKSKEHLNNDLTKHSFVVLFDKTSKKDEDVNRRALFYYFEQAKEEGLVTESEITNKNMLETILNGNDFHIYYLTIKGSDEVYFYFL